MTPVRLEPAVSRSQIKHSTTESLHSHEFLMENCSHVDEFISPPPHIQIITNACQVCFSAYSLIKKLTYNVTSTQFQYLTFQTNPRGQGCV